MPRLRLALLGASLIGALVLLAGSAAAPASQSGPSNISSFKHVFVIMMENTGIEALLGNPNAPWINQAVQTYGVAGNYYGVTHPSQPNYIAATSGTTERRPGRQRRHDQRAEHRRSARERTARRGRRTCSRTLALHDERARARVRKPAVRAQAQPVRLLPRRAVEPGTHGEHRRPQPVRDRPGEQHGAGLLAGSAPTSATTCTAAAAAAQPTRATSRTSSR